MDEDHNQKRGPRVAKQPWAFLAVFLVIFFVVAVFLYAIDFVPETPPASTNMTNTTETLTTAPATSYVTEAPVRVMIHSIGVDTPIENPETTNLAALDQELLKGAVRHPASAFLGEVGTVYLFGHQSYLPVVKNRAFKAFNDIQKLKEGDLITVSSATADYGYRVTSVELTTAEEGVVALPTDSRYLVLSTCNSLSSNHEQRYVVTAEFTGRTEHLASNYY